MNIDEDSNKISTESNGTLKKITCYDQVGFIGIQRFFNIFMSIHLIYYIKRADDHIWLSITIYDHINRCRKMHMIKFNIHS